MRLLVCFLGFCLLTCFCLPARAQDEDRTIPLEIPKGQKCDDSVKIRFFREFTLLPPACGRFALALHQDSISHLMQWNNDHWQAIDKIDERTAIWTDLKCNLEIPLCYREDFNQDGFEDLLLMVMTNVNGNQWTRIYLYDPSTDQLKRIKSAERDGGDESGIWAAPTYHPADSTIHCTEICGQYGIYYESTYKLRGLTPIPLFKKEEDSYQRDYRGRNVYYRQYKGYRGGWKLMKQSRS